MWFIIALFYSRSIVVRCMEIQWRKVENRISLVSMNRYGSRYGLISCLECFITRSGLTSAPTLLTLLFIVTRSNCSAFDLNWNLERDLHGTDSICVFCGVWSSNDVSSRGVLRQGYTKCWHLCFAAQMWYNIPAHNSHCATLYCTLGHSWKRQYGC